MARLNLEGSAHWYDCRTGEPKLKDGADLRVARKEFLYPSPTSVDKSEFRNEFIERYKTTQLLMAASGNAMQPHEAPDQYEKRIYEISLEKVHVAAEFGKKIHSGMQHYPAPVAPDLVPWMDRFSLWYQGNVAKSIAREKILVDHDICVAGMADHLIIRIDGEYGVDDYKSQGVRKDEKGRKKPAFYDSWRRQLAFYAVAWAKEMGIYPKLPTCRSVVIDSTEADDPFIKEYTQEEILSDYEDFVIACYRWFKGRKYWPHKNGPFTLAFNGIPMPNNPTQN